MKPLFSIGDAVDSNISLTNALEEYRDPEAWHFAGVIAECKPHDWGTFAYFVKHVGSVRSYGIEAFREGMWYSEAQLRLAHNPHID